MAAGKISVWNSMSGEVNLDFLQCGEDVWTAKENSLVLEICVH